MLNINLFCFVHLIEQRKYGKLEQLTEFEVLYATYQSLISESKDNVKAKDGAPPLLQSRLEQIIDYCGEGFDGLVSLLLV